MKMQWFCYGHLGKSSHYVISLNITLNSNTTADKLHWFKKKHLMICTESLWGIVKKNDSLQCFVNIFWNLYLNSSCFIKADDGITDSVTVSFGVWILLLVLFLLTVGLYHEESSEGDDFGYQCSPTDMTFSLFIIPPLLFFIYSSR